MALARLARTNTTPYRVVLKLGNTNIKAAIVDDRRDLTVSPVPVGNTVALRVHRGVSPAPVLHSVLAALCRWPPRRLWSPALRRSLRNCLRKIALSLRLLIFLHY